MKIGSNIHGECIEQGQYHSLEAKDEIREAKVHQP